MPQNPILIIKAAKLEIRRDSSRKGEIRRIDPPVPCGPGFGCWLFQTRHCGGLGSRVLGFSVRGPAQELQLKDSSLLPSSACTLNRIPANRDVYYCTGDFAG